MTRLYVDLNADRNDDRNAGRNGDRNGIDVRTADSGAGPDPVQFLWRGRLYVVRAVLARWTEAGQWWSAPAVRAITSGDRLDPPADDPLETAPIPASPKWAQRAWGEPAPDVPATRWQGVSPLGGVDDRERSWWRVEAGRGAQHGTGVFDLCLDVATGSWVLARVLD